MEKKYKLSYIKNLDGLRGIASISVLIFHFFYDKKLTSDIENILFAQKLTELLQHGVTLFFVLSGFVITRILINNKKDSNYFSSFYKRRALRIFPLYYLYLIVHYYIFPYLIGMGPNLEFERQIPVYLYLHNLNWLTGFKASGPGQFWSLAVEEHFYLIWPLVIFLIPNKNFRLVTIILIIISIPLKMFFLENGIDINHNTFSRYDSILVGCFIAIIEKENNYKLPRLTRNFTIYTLISVLVTGLTIYIFQDKIFFFKSIVKHIILSSFFGIIIYYLITTSSQINPTNRFLNSKIIQYLGKISYGLYVWHMLAIAICGFLNIDIYLVNLLFVIIITILLSHLSYFYYERNFLKLKK
jgi:peptidoglycan/LPS O-acetylase OafA/YrhL